MYISDIIEKQLLVKTKILITFLYVFYTCYKNDCNKNDTQLHKSQFYYSY